MFQSSPGRSICKHASLLFGLALASLIGCTAPNADDPSELIASPASLEAANTVTALEAAPTESAQAEETMVSEVVPNATVPALDSPTPLSPEPSPTPEPLPTLTPTATAFAPPMPSEEEVEEQGEPQATIAISQTLPAPATDPAQINGLPVDSIVVLPAETAENVRQIFARGQELGRNANAFSKLGDSLIATPNFLTPFDTGKYDLGPYAALQPAIDYYAGSFERYGVALRPGLHAWGVFDPLWANKDWCQPNEDLLSCEFRLNNPSAVLILLGTNDAGNPPGFDWNMRKVIEFAIDQGVIPIIATKADRFEGPENTNNNILRQIAADYQVPLWDFDLVAGTIPGRGLTDDQVHLTVPVENNYNLPEVFQTGHGVHNLTALMVLDAVRQIITEG